MAIAALLAVVAFAQKPFAEQRRANANALRSDVQSRALTIVDINGNETPVPAGSGVRKAPRKAEVVTPPSGNVQYYELYGQNSRGTSNTLEPLKFSLMVLIFMLLV